MMCQLVVEEYSVLFQERSEDQHWKSLATAIEMGASYAEACEASGAYIDMVNLSMWENIPESKLEKMSPKAIMKIADALAKKI